MLVNDTAVEVHHIRGVPVHVKREDLSAPLPGPEFSKMRGVVAHIKNRPEKVIGVLDTLHSKAGWCVSYVCQQLGKKAVNYWPRYKADGPDGLPRPQQRNAQTMGADMVELKAGRSAVLYHSAKKHLRATYGEDVYMMPNALKLPESITENAAEAYRTAMAVKAGTSSPLLPDEAALVISISSGTVAAGVIRGFLEAHGNAFLEQHKVYLHMGYSRSIDTCRKYMESIAGIMLPSDRVIFIDEGYGYADRISEAEHAAIPFPCNPHYDGKAWAWLGKNHNAEALRAEHGDIILWSIGA